MQNEAEIALRVECNGCAISACTPWTRALHMNQNARASVTPLLSSRSAAGENGVFTDERATAHHVYTPPHTQTRTHFVLNYCPGLASWSYPHFLVYRRCHSSANTLLPPQAAKQFFRLHLPPLLLPRPSASSAGQTEDCGSVSLQYDTEK